VGIAAGLLGSAIIALIVAFGSGFAGMYAGIQDSSAAILAVADQLAERAGISVRTVFRHFPSQRDLLEAATPYLLERSGWRPDEMTADNFAEMSARAFAYFGGLLESIGRDLDPMPPRLRPNRVQQRIAPIERALGPLMEGMEPEQARAMLAVLSGLTRINFLRGMHEQWGTRGEDAGKAVEWAVTTLLGALREKQARWKQDKSRKPRPRKRS
jgi:AcrR family transcriptional regulator